MKPTSLPKGMTSAKWWAVGILLLVVILTAAATSPAAALNGPDALEGLDHSGTIDNRTEDWLVADNPHRIIGALTIGTNGIVRLEPGVLIQISPNINVTVNGTLTMTSASPAALTTITAENANFGRLDFAGSSKVALRMCDISLGGSGQTEVLTIQSSNVLLQDCEIHHNTPTTQAVRIVNINTNPTLTNLTIRDHSSVPALVQENVNANPNYSNITLTNNNGLLGNMLTIASGTAAATVNNGSKITINGPAFNGSPVYFKNGLTVVSGGAITFTAGSDVQLGVGKNIDVYNGSNGPGRLTAVGEPDKLITFSGRDGNFAQLFFNGSSSDPNSAAVWMKNCLISKGGTGKNEALRISSSNVILEDCTLTNHIGTAQTIYIGGANDASSRGLAPTLRNLTIQDSNGYAIAQRLVDMAPVYDNITMTNNTPNGIYLGAGTLERAVTLDQQDINGAPFYAGLSPAGLVTVISGASLTIKDGTELRLLPGSNLIVAGGGTLDAQSTDSAQPVVFRTVLDSPPSDFEYWRTFDFQLNSTVRLANCQFRHGGGAPSGQTAPSEAIKIASSDVQINDCLIETTSPTQRVILITGAGISPLMHNLTIQNNEGYAIVHDNINANPDLDNVTLTNNTGVGGLDGDTYVIGTGGSAQVVSTLVTLDGPSINDSPYYLPNGATINLGSVLTFTAGTEVELGPIKNLIVNGRLFAEGSSPETLVEIRSKGSPFTRLDFGTAAEASLRYCDITQGGGNATEIIRINSSQVSIQDCVIHDNTMTGTQTQAILIGTALKLTPVFRNLTISNNNGYGIAQTSADMGPTYDNLLFTGNTLNGIYLAAGTTTFDLVLNVDELNGSPYYGNNITVPAGKSLTLTPGTELRLLPNSVLTLAGSLTAVGTPERHVLIHSNKAAPLTTEYWRNLLVQSGSSLTLEYCELSHAGNGATYVLDITSPSQLSINNSLLAENGVSNSSIILGLKSTTTTMRNMVLIDNLGSAVHTSASSLLTADHFTIARNSFAGVFVATTADVFLNNSILAENGTAGVLNSAGVSIDNGGEMTTTRVLWDNNTPAQRVAGQLTKNNDLQQTSQGSPESYFARFAWDGYHLTRYSDALNMAQASTLTDDYDAQVRPLPTGSLADLGADEYIYAYGSDFAVEKGAYAPKWVIAEDELGNPYGFLRQDYALRIFQGSADVAPSTFVVTDTLPADMSFGAEVHNPAMQFQSGAELTWQSEAALNQGDTGIVIFSSQGSPAVGSELVNEGILQAGSLKIPFGAASSVPVIAPLIYAPVSGDICAGNITLQGAAQPGATVKLFAGATELTQVTADAAGLFSYTYAYPGGGVALTAEACFGPECATSNAVNLITTASCSSGGSALTATLSGLVYDVSQGASSPVQGVTVTVMVSMPLWGGWIPFPAALYDSQNSQVTGPDGQFSFQLPPGSYYLQAESLPGFQPWRSPVVQATNGPLTVQVPYTPFNSPADVVLTVDESGVSNADAHVLLGQTVEWQAAMDSLVTPAEWIALLDTPGLRLLSTLVPGVNPNAFDSGMLAAGFSYRRSFNQMGEYSYSDGNGHTARILVVDSPLTGLAAANSGPVQLGQPMTFTATVTGGSNPTFTWNFDDGTPTVTGAVVQHTYTAIGSYDVTVAAANTSNSLNAGTTAEVVDVPVSGLQGQHSSPAYVGQPVDFSATVTGGSNVVFTWDFGAENRVGANITYTFDAPGLYTVTLTAANGANTLSLDLPVQVEDVPVAGLNASFTGTPKEDQTLTFNATVTAGTNVIYTWDFDDGTPSQTGPSVQHVFSTAGTYTVTVTATNSSGEVSKEVIVVVQRGITSLYLPLTRK